MSCNFIRRLFYGAALSIATVALVAVVPAFAQGQGGGKGGGGGGETTLGNNLSVPAVFAEGIGVTGLVIGGVPLNTGLRPTAEDNCPTPPCFDSSSAMVVNGVTYYPQQTASTWRAGYIDAGPNGTNTIQEVTVAWSDNITGQYWTPRSKVRVETVLSESPTSGPLTAYNMFSLSGTKRTELFATDSTTFDSLYRTVFSPLAHLTIQKLTGENGTLVFTCFDGAVYQSFGTEGGGGYTAEVNGSGNLIYGYNWDVASCSSDPTALSGWWRLTFKIDPSATIGGATVNSNTNLVALAPSGALFVPKLDTSNNQSTLDIKITETRKGGGKKGGGTGE
jgi:hypothetical protein